MSDEKHWQTVTSELLACVNEYLPKKHRVSKGDIQRILNNVESHEDPMDTDCGASERHYCT